MPAFNFQSRFAPLVQSGRKKTTIRGREVKVGSTAYLFTGQRTRACVRLGQGEIVSCTPIKLGWRENGCPFVQLRSKRLNTVTMHQMAVSEGFGGTCEMVNWFEMTYKQYKATAAGDDDVYTGYLIEWR